MHLVDIPNGEKKKRKLKVKFILCRDCPIKPIVTVVINEDNDWYKYLYGHFSTICRDCKNMEWIEDE